MYLYLDFRVTFKEQAYVFGNKNDGDFPELQLIYPEEYDNFLQIFPIIVSIGAQDITATGELH